MGGPQYLPSPTSRSAIGAFQGNVGPDAQPAGVDGFGLAYLYEARVVV